MYLASKITADPSDPARWSPVIDNALEAFELVYAFIYARVGNWADAEDLTQQVALKALPRLHEGAPAPAVRGYLYATARSVLATFWSGRMRIRESELPEDVWIESQGELLPSAGDAAWVARVLDTLTPSQRRVLELRFLYGYSLREVAGEMGKSVSNVKVLQLRALRKAAATATPYAKRRPLHGPATAEPLLMQAGGKA
jgi:RNA polymerase sigma factor (sigma-70 family)